MHLVRFTSSPSSSGLSNPSSFSVTLDSFEALRAHFSLRTYIKIAKIEKATTMNAPIDRPAIDCAGKPQLGGVVESGPAVADGVPLLGEELRIGF
jgi:hypothetical protein